MDAKPELLRHHINSAALRRYVRDDLGQRRVLLSFSCGKDAVASWIALREDGFEVVPFFLYLVPGLRLIDEGLSMYEAHFKTPILRVPHPSLARWLRNNTFAPPGRWEQIAEARVPSLSHAQVEDEVRRRTGLDGWIGIGTRAADSLARRANQTRYGSLTPSRRSFLPVFDWGIDDVIDAIGREGCGLPDDYRLFGRSFDGLDYRFLRPLRDHYPDDYDRVRAWFPCVEMEFIRRGESP